MADCGPADCEPAEDACRMPCRMPWRVAGRAGPIKVAGDQRARA
jgi:hypothetical protein